MKTIVKFKPQFNFGKKFLDITKVVEVSEKYFTLRKRNGVKFKMSKKTFQGIE